MTGTTTWNAPRPLRWVLVASVAAVAGALSLVPLFALPSREATSVAGLMHVGALAVALGSMIRSTRTSDSAMRRPRMLLAAALGASASGALIGVGHVVVGGSIPVPSLADPVTLLWVPLAARALWLVPTRTGGRMSRRRLFADGAVAGSALLFASWLAVLEPIAASARWSPVGQVVQTAYPICDIFMAAVVLSLLPRVRADLRPFFSCVALGLILIAAADSGSAILLAQRGSVSFGWPDLLLQAGLMALVVATRVRPGAVVTGMHKDFGHDRGLPFLPVGIAMLVGLVYVAKGGTLELDDALLAGLMLLSIIVRTLMFTRELAIASEEHRRAAVHDELTGLGNRKVFIARLTEHVGTPGAAPAAVLLADLDGFKEVNDTFGHECGDLVLKAFAAALSSACGTQLAARLGGDEFAVLIVGDAPEQAARALALQLNGFHVPRVGVSADCSIGIAALRSDDTAADALRRADLAMYSAKAAGGGRMATFTDNMAAECDRRNLLISQLPVAVSRGEMRLVYQPLYRLADGTLAGAEALLRWTHPVFGAVPPAEFIPLAEDSGAIRAIGAWVLETGLAQVAEWEGAGRHLPQLFVNTAAAQFTDGLAGDVGALLQRYGVSADRLTLEITETQLPGLAVNRSMRRLRDAGVRIALDDFGAGYSSLAQLARLPVDVLKIDRDFIRNLDVACGRPVMDAVISLAKALGLTTVAEGVEDLGQAAEVANVGVDLAQGYLFSHPVDHTEIFDKLPLMAAASRQSLPAVPRSRPARTGIQSAGTSLRTTSSLPGSAGSPRRTT